MQIYNLQKYVQLGPTRLSDSFISIKIPFCLNFCDHIILGCFGFVLVMFWLCFALLQFGRNELSNFSFLFFPLFADLPSKPIAIVRPICAASAASQPDDEPAKKKLRPAVSTETGKMGSRN